MYLLFRIQPWQLLERQERNRWRKLKNKTESTRSFFADNNFPYPIKKPQLKGNSLCDSWRWNSPGELLPMEWGTARGATTSSFTIRLLLHHRYQLFIGGKWLNLLSFSKVKTLTAIMWLIQLFNAPVQSFIGRVIKLKFLSFGYLVFLFLSTVWC